MTRRRYDFHAGTISTSNLLIAGTTLNSTALASLPAVTAPDYVVLVLDPDEVAGVPEVVYVTAHTASATSATIARAQEDASTNPARQHNIGIKWRHVATVKDFDLPDGSVSEVNFASTYRHKATFSVTSGAAGVTVIPHGASFTPGFYQILFTAPKALPNAVAGWVEFASPDGTNVTVRISAAQSGSVAGTLASGQTVTGTIVSEA